MSSINGNLDVEKRTLDEDERWQALAEADLEHYEVSTLGRVRNKRKNYILGGKTSDNGYRYVGLLGSDGRVRTRVVHRLVATAFIKPQDGKSIVDHINRQRSDNRAENLRWVSPSESNANRTVITTKSGTERPIQQLDADGNLMRIWPSAATAGRELNIDICQIGAAAKQTRVKTAGGYMWRFVDHTEIDAEVWKDLTLDIGRAVALSSAGRVKFSNGRVSHGSKENGYMSIKVRSPNKCKQSKRYMVHRLVWQAFNGHIPVDQTIDHVNRNKVDNRLCNLRLASSSDQANNRTYKHYTIRSRRLRVTTLATGISKEYASFAAAASETGWLDSRIRRACVGTRPSPKGYQISFV